MTDLPTGHSCDAVFPDPLDAATLHKVLVDGGAWRHCTVLGEVPSTNAWCLAQPERIGDKQLVTAEHQVAGRGRLDRTWHTPAGVALTSSLVVVPTTPRPTWGWLTMMTGLSVVEALRTLGVQAWLKWPNDVLVGEPGRKICGVLAEVCAPAHAVIVGFGVNVHTADGDLLETATSLRQCGVQVRRTDLLIRCVQQFDHWYRVWSETAGDAVASGLLAAVQQHCGTLGQQVAVTLPGGRGVVRGRAVELDATGCLMIDDGGTTHQIASGDIIHAKQVQ